MTDQLDDIAAGPPDLLTVEEAMRILRLGRTTLYRQASLYIETNGAEGDVPAKKFGRKIRILRAQLEERLGTQITWPIPPATDVDELVEAGTEPTDETAARRNRTTPKPETARRRAAKQAKASRNTNRSRTAKEELPFSA